MAHSRTSRWFPNSGEEAVIDGNNGTSIENPSRLTKTEDFSDEDLHFATRKEEKDSNSHLMRILNSYLLPLAFGIASILLFLTVTTASKNQTMLAALQPYAVDVANMTNKTWGYGYIPIKMASVDKTSADSHSHHDSVHEGSSSDWLSELPTETEDLDVLLKDTWRPSQGNYPFTIFPTTSDTLDELRPDEKVTFERNFLVKKHVSTVMQYNRRIAANVSYRTSHTICKVQHWVPPYQSILNNKTLITSNAPIDIWLLETPPDGEWWSGKGFAENGKYALRSDMTWNSRPRRRELLGTVQTWFGMNIDAEKSFECPKITGRKGERIAIEFACAPGPMEESCFVSFDVRMTYPVLMFEVVF